LSLNTILKHEQIIIFNVTANDVDRYSIFNYLMQIKGDCLNNSAITLKCTFQVDPLVSRQMYAHQN